MVVAMSQRFLEEAVCDVSIVLANGNCAGFLEHRSVAKKSSNGSFELH